MTKFPQSRLGLAVLTSIALIAAGCDSPRQTAAGVAQKTEGAAESAGQKIDRAADAAGQKIDRATNEVAADAKVAAAKAAVVLDDTAITAKVKGALYAEPGLKMLQLEVSTHDGVVTLTGSVDSALLRQRAIEVAGAMSGVRQVVDHLVVKS